MNKIKSLVALAAFSLLILGLPAIASAQWNGGYGNGGYGNGGYGNGNVKSTVKNLKNRAKTFENAVDRYDDRNDDDDDDRYNNGRYGGWGGNNNGNYNSGNLERLADQFKNATDDLEDAFGNGRNMNNSADEARRVLDIASQIDREVNRSRSGSNNIRNQWNSIRYDLDTLANAYGYNTNNRNNRRNRNGNWRNNIPFPLPF